MADDTGILLIRVMRGEERLSTAFWVSLLVMSVYAAYELYVPSLSDVFDPFYRFFRVTVITYTVAAIHNSCHESAIFWRLLARTYVLLLLAAGSYVVFLNYGVMWAFAYPVIVTAIVFVVKE
jgi:hypothetical protein